jgi:enoyl-CoA hydratase/carnithine racemase
MADDWVSMHVWPELYLEQLPGCGVARIVLNRPEKRNSLTGTLLEAYFEALAIIRADRELKVVITKGAGSVFSSGMYLPYLREIAKGPLPDWDTSFPNIRLTEALRVFPRVTIAQVHGYCLGASLALMNAHDLVIAADDVQIGMPEVMRGSFGQIATATLFHANIPIKKSAFMQLVGRNVSGAEADRLGLVSMAVPAAELESTTTELARELGMRHLVTLEHAKIAVQMGRDLPLSDAIKLDQLVGSRQARGVDATADVESYLKSQKGGPNLAYKRPDV